MRLRLAAVLQQLRVGDGRKHRWTASATAIKLQVSFLHLYFIGYFGYSTYHSCIFVLSSEQAAVLIQRRYSDTGHRMYVKPYQGGSAPTPPQRPAKREGAIAITRYAGLWALCSDSGRPALSGFRPLPMGSKSLADTRYNHGRSPCSSDPHVARKTGMLRWPWMGHDPWALG